MEALDLDGFEAGLSDKAATLLPDGTTCFVARYVASRDQLWALVGLVAASPILVAGASFPSARTASLVLLFGLVAGLAAWHLLTYRAYRKEVAAGCHMRGVFLFTATRDVVVRFRRTLGSDVEASYSRDTLIAVAVRRPVESCACETCLVLESAAGVAAAPPVLRIPRSWLVDDLETIAASIERHLGVGASFVDPFDQVVVDDHGSSPSSLAFEREQSPSSSHSSLYELAQFQVHR